MTPHSPPLTREEVAALLHAARGRRGGERWYLVFALCYFLGLRLSEVLALRLDQAQRDVHGVVRVVEVPTVRRGRDARTMRRPTLPVRVLSAHTLVGAAFRADGLHRRAAPGSAFVFPGDVAPDDPADRPLRLTSAAHAFRRCAAAARLPGRPTSDDLRATASEFVAAAAGRRVRSVWLRHSRSRRDFGHYEVPESTWRSLEGVLDLPPLRPLDAANPDRRDPHHHDAVRPGATAAGVHR